MTSLHEHDTRVFQVVYQTTSTTPCEKTRRQRLVRSMDQMMEVEVNHILLQEIQYAVDDCVEKMKKYSSQ
jgi:hypothetical protein